MDAKKERSYHITLPPLASSQKDFSNALLGNRTITLLHNVMMNERVVVRSDRPNSPYVVVDLKSKDKKNDALYIAQYFGNEILRNNSPLGAGGFNITYAVPRARVAAYFSNMFSKDVLPEGLPDLIFRRSHKTITGRRPEQVFPTGLNAVSEIIIASYAAYYGLGPEIFASYILPFDVQRSQPTDLVKLYMFTQKMNGDLQSPIASRMFGRKEFADAFVDLLTRSVQHGVWQLDAKPPNMLWNRVGGEARGARDGALQFYWTDFDSTYCHLWASNIRATDVGKCSAVVHAAMIMGYISCNIGKESFEYYLPSVAEKMEKVFGISKLGEGGYCDWIDELERSNVVTFGTGDGVAEAKKRIASSFRRSMEHYVTDKSQKTPLKPQQRCILSSVLEKPTLMQFFDFAVAEADAQNVMYWSTGIMPPRRENQAQEDLLTPRSPTTLKKAHDQEEAARRDAVERSKVEADRQRAERAAGRQEEAEEKAEEREEREERERRAQERAKTARRAREQEEAARRGAVERSKAEAEQARAQKAQEREEAARRAQERAEAARRAQERAEAARRAQEWAEAASRRVPMRPETASEAAARRARGDWPKQRQMWPIEDVLKAWQILTKSNPNLRNDQLAKSLKQTPMLIVLFKDENLKLRLALGFTDLGRQQDGNKEQFTRIWGAMEQLPGAALDQDYRSVSQEQFMNFLSARTDYKAGRTLAAISPQEVRRDREEENAAAEANRR